MGRERKILVGSRVEPDWVILEDCFSQAIKISSVQQLHAAGWVNNVAVFSPFCSFPD